MQPLKKIIALVFVLLSLAVHGNAQVKNVDNFLTGKDSVSAFFYDPLDALYTLNQNFFSKSDKQKASALNDYLHGHALYLFRVVNNKIEDTTFLCIRGNPAITNTKMFYKVEVIKNVAEGFEPNVDNYANKIVKIIDHVNCGGTLFENMSLFDNEIGKKAVGNGTLLFGYFMRVQPYSEIKESITYIISQLSVKP